MTNLDSILKSRDITLTTKVRLVKAMVFPVVMRVGLWRRLSTKKLMLLDCVVGRLLRVPWNVRWSNQSILKEISPGCSLEGLMLKLNLQYFGHLMRSTDSFKEPDAGKDWRREEKGMTEDEMVGWHHQLNRHESEASSGSWWWTGKPGMLQFMGSQRVRHNWPIELSWCDTINASI